MQLARAVRRSRTSRPRPLFSEFGAGIHVARSALIDARDHPRAPARILNRFVRFKLMRLLLHAHSARSVWLCSVLTLCLQRAPVIRMLVGGEAGGRIGAGHVLRALIPAALATSGVVHAQTGATQFVTNPANPVSGTVGVGLSVVFAFSGSVATPESYSIIGVLPPGLTVPGASGAAGNLTVNGSSGSITGTPSMSGDYTVSLEAYDSPNRGAGEHGSSPVFSLTFNIAPAADIAPAFTQHPQSATVESGGTVAFAVAVTGSPAPTLQWRKDTQAIAGESGTSLVLNNLTVDAAGAYDCVATNPAGTATSQAATLTVTPGAPPVISVQPGSMTARAGSGAFFSVQATGNALEYQWRRDDADLAGETGPTLFLGGIQAADGGVYACVISNAGGSVTSAGATLTVVATGGARLVNLSARALVGTGGNILIPGFSISGAGSKNLLVRAVGPRLGMPDFGVTGVLADPTIVVLAGSSPVAMNDDWGLVADPAALAAATLKSGAFPLDGSTKDSALVLSVGPGGYTVQTSGVAATSGVALVELYDIDDATSAGRLVNLSARAQVGTGGDILIPGFVIDGNVAMTLLIRGAGPTLGLPPFDVAGVLADPVMTVLRGSSVVAVNDDWQEAPNQPALLAAQAATGAFAFGDGERDSALLVALPPGAYTVQVAGKDEGTGVALVELYVVGP